MARHLSALIAFISLASLAGCSSGPAGEVKIGVDVAAIRSTTAAAADVTGLELSRVRVLVARAKVGYTGGKCSGSSAEVGPFVIDLTADEIASGAHRELSLGALDSGTYGGAEIEIEPLGAKDDTSDAAVADFVTEGASLLVDGTYQREPFHFAGHFLAEQGTDGEFTVDASAPITLAMTVDPSTWFVDEKGAAIDPSIEAQHDALAVAVCKTLDTQPVVSSPEKGGKGGGGEAHCVE
jgi:hypothetical protein